MESGERCSSCGTSPWEWDEDSFAYMAVRQTCLGCQRKDLMRDEEEGKAPAGSSVVLIPRAAADRLLEQRAQIESRHRQEGKG